MRKTIQILTAALLAACLSFPVAARQAAPRWEPVVTEQAADLDSASEPDRVEVEVRDGYIYVTTLRPASVKVLSILGQLISQQNIPAGTSRLRISARGIYILKIGTITKRVTI